MVFRKVIKNPVYSNGEIIGVCGAVSDVTELMNLKKKFENLTFTDQLTGIYNRNYFLKHDFDKKSCLPCAYVMCDCNDLKETNDKIGHEAGDQYIQTAALIMQKVLPDRGICVRWGGDEFLLIIPECEEQQCQKLVEEIERLQQTEKEKVPYMELAIGFAVRHSFDEKEAETIQRADQKMYEDKIIKKRR